MSQPVIRVEGLGKKYKLTNQQKGAFEYKTLRDAMSRSASALVRPFFRSKSTPNQPFEEEEFWALNGVSLEVQQGDRIGVIGRNGAGKSTLLKILSRITEPTTGRVWLRGRVASLLEVGTGFHSELSGRENIFLNGAILGMEVKEIRRKFDEIVNFAEVEKFLDTPVKHYSSGMYVRLAFAVAAHLDPDILIVDEVLAVGDIDFQKKCLGKMGEVATTEGRTVLFVSHQMGAIRALCNQSVLLSKGKVEKYGKTADVIEYYLRSTVSTENEGEMHWPDAQSAPGGQEMRLRSVRLLDREEIPRSLFDANQPIFVEVTYELYQVVTAMRIFLRVLNAEGIEIFCTTDYNYRSEAVSRPGGYRSICTIPENLMNGGSYYVKLSSDCPGVRVLMKPQEILTFKVEKAIAEPYLTISSMIAPELAWNVRTLQPGSD